VLCTLSTEPLTLTEMELLAILLLLPAWGTSVQAPSQSTAPSLAGTSWQLVKFQGSDDKTMIPDDKAKYTIQFNTDGSLSARIDCNRGRGTWKSAGPSQLQFGSLGLTRAMCPPGSLHDVIVKHWGFIRSYVIRDGHLLSVADGRWRNLRIRTIPEQTGGLF
jgi:heat shock protein HslJ